MKQPYPFLLGAQYYRAPTPEPECWPADLRRMRELGFNAVKYWVQWRWSHRLGGQYFFDDLDRLMDLASENGLQVTLNVIFDVAPHWLYDTYPDARQVLNNGQVVQPYVVGHRQIGGHPGPCYCHPGALAERQKFMSAVVDHFKNHSAMAMWDVWNEPELCFPQRAARIDTLACYCPNCQAAFLEWLRRKYASLEMLNKVWGRCYENWEQVEVPRSAQAFTDFIDWREFHIDTMSQEAAWRLDMTRRQDPAHTAYLHVVPNVLSPWNPVSCATDDFDLAAKCDVFAATMNGGPVMAQQVLSAARGKTCYNVESHLNFGSTGLHQRILSLDDLLKDWLPQIGLGIRGFLFWQYRPEVLGLESPAWGLVNLDGSDRPITRAVQTFTRAILPHTRQLMDCPAPRPQAAIWKSRKNEIFHFAVHGDFNRLADSLEGYIRILYSYSIPYRNIDSEMLAAGDLEGIKLLIMPSPYYLTQAEADALDAWVRGGGVLIAEAHLAGYSGTTGRHARVVPGCGLAESWGLREVESTSSIHLKPRAGSSQQGSYAQMAAGESLPEDVRKALAGLETSGSEYFPIWLASGGLAWGCDRYAVIQGDDLAVEGWYEPGSPCLAVKPVGTGAVFYLASRLGQGSKKGSTGLASILHKACERAGVTPTAGLRGPGSGKVRVDLVEDHQGPRFLVLHNHSADDQEIQLDPLPDGRGLFTGTQWALSESKPLIVPGGFIDLVVF